MKFAYGTGQRPLDGYTIKRGIGRGGFGEVYFGVSDGGKEVALKLLRGNQDVELRGVAQCLNLKHPHLVGLFDLKTDSHGDPWVVMEYVSGETLNVVLHRHPNGLPAELAQQWFLGLARAVGYLHDHGIVHRDLKPGNIFLENGQLKVGDYGLCKSMSGTQNARQSQSVGTVHYMAPEVSTGNYNKQIDVYAAGVILYEMLTGKVPFDGESAGEILMKHLTSPPDLSKLPPEFVPVVAKALAKNPTLRYSSMAEMAKAVEAALGQPKRPAPTPARPSRPVPVLEPVLTALPVSTWWDQATELCGSLALSTLFAALAAALVTTAWGWAGEEVRLADAGQFFFLTVLVSWAVLIPAKFWAGRRGDSWYRRVIMLVCGILVGVGAIWLEGWLPRLPQPGVSGPNGEPVVVSAIFPSTGLGHLAAYLSYFALTFFALRWWKMADPKRSSRFSFIPVLAAGFWCLLLSWVCWPAGPLALIPTVAASVIVQLVSPYEPPPQPATARRLRLRHA
jgi:eukaryotic-like serine/threonine-protein kinase